MRSRFCSFHEPMVQLLQVTRLGRLYLTELVLPLPGANIATRVSSACTTVQAITCHFKASFGCLHDADDACFATALDKPITKAASLLTSQ